MSELGAKIRQVFPDIAIKKDAANYSVFAGRNLPSFVKDFLVRKYTQSGGALEKLAIADFLNKYIPDKNNPLINRLIHNETVQLLTRFIVQADIQGGTVRFAIPDSGIKASDAVIPKNLLNEYKKELIDGETWGVIKLVYVRPSGREKGHIEMVDFKPFRPYSVDLEYFKECRQQFTTEEWVDVLISAMEYSPAGFATIEQKLEFLTRLLIFVEPNLNMIELAPKETGKSYVFGNLSKFGWLVSGGRVSRAKLFYDKSRKVPGLFYNHDFLAFDEIQTISLTDESELQGIFKSYLEQGKATVDNYEFMSSAGLMLMGNIKLTREMLPANATYFSELPSTFRDSAFLDRFHGFIEGWKLPKIRNDMFLKDWTLNVEYFSEILHQLRTSSEYALLFDKVVYVDEKSGARDLKAVKKLATAYSKLLFPHITKAEALDKDEFQQYCLEPVIRRRGVIREQCHRIDAEFKAEMS
ncbi:hypothetical protein FACS1894201_11060 [Bacteroidia bacterium]|nr:hypothetical protein FACS1894201_11060 [Bacteroidia bacterium]